MEFSILCILRHNSNLPPFHSPFTVQGREESLSKIRKLGMCTQSLHFPFVFPSSAGFLILPQCPYPSWQWLSSSCYCLPCSFSSSLTAASSDMLGLAPSAEWVRCKEKIRLRAWLPICIRVGHPCCEARLDYSIAPLSPKLSLRFFSIQMEFFVLLQVGYLITTWEENSSHFCHIST